MSDSDVVCWSGPLPGCPEWCEQHSRRTDDLAMECHHKILLAHDAPAGNRTIELTIGETSWGGMSGVDLGLTVGGGLPTGLRLATARALIDALQAGIAMVERIAALCEICGEPVVIDGDGPQCVPCDVRERVARGPRLRIV